MLERLEDLSQSRIQQGGDNEANPILLYISGIFVYSDAFLGREGVQNQIQTDLLLFRQRGLLNSTPPQGDTIQCKKIQGDTIWCRWCKAI